jgi:hypothetical protein
MEMHGSAKASGLPPEPRWHRPMAESRVPPASKMPSQHSGGSDRRPVGEAPRVHRRQRPKAADADLLSLARQRAVQSRRAQGLPDHITDPTSLDQVAQLVLADRPPAWSARPPP